MPGAFKLFKIFGITVYLHWSWFLIFLYEVQLRSGEYQNATWNAVEVISLFAIVLMHEFGHALACRSVGGKAERIVLWPFGGIAFVQPPWRPGAMLWSIVAGPLVNVLLIPVTIGLYAAEVHALPLSWIMSDPARFLPRLNFFLFETPITSDFMMYLRALVFINLALLIFNILPIYPLDGGKIVWSILWFFLGDATALRVAAIFGLVGSISLIGFLLLQSGGSGFNNIYLIMLGAFLVMQAWRGVQQSRKLAASAKMPRHPECLCPACRRPAPAGDFWQCGHCQSRFDMFANRGRCPSCGADYQNLQVRCPDCGNPSRVSDWFTAATVNPLNSGTTKSSTAL
ncbi:MAG TPA: site-2 protease family protein [Phycisphaerae bacterium]|nr:site-2 protease family protein [Phycisphaerae bacterium]